MGRRIIAVFAVVMVGVLAISTSMSLWLGSLGRDVDEPRRREAIAAGNTTQNASKLHEGVVLIEAHGAGQGGTGTGMIISPDGLVVTNYHVVEYGLHAEVEVAITGEVFDAELLGFDRAVDIAVLQLEGASGLSTIEFTDQLAVGDVVTAVGNANGQGFLSDIPGTVTAMDSSIWVSEDPFVNESLKMEGLISTNADIASGCSGGPVFNGSGQVVGVTVAGSDSKRPEGYAIPAEDAQAVVDTILAGTDMGSTRVGPYGTLGALLTDSTGVVTSSALVTGTTSRGAEIANLQHPSPARDAGMEVGDVIRSFDGNPITSSYDLYVMMKLYEPGDIVQVIYTDSTGGKFDAAVELTPSTTF